ncbi:MAG: ABC transporter permease [Acidobacteria bacterium]|nr:ABC transporter permease [Acidobacteriota bacterium]
MTAVFWQDVHYAFRRLRGNWTFTFVVALTPALGTGANTAMFSILNAVLLRPLPLKNPDRLLMLWTAFPAAGVNEDRTSGLNVEDLTRESRSFEDVGIADPVTITLTGGPEATRVSAAAASANLFPLLGVAPAIGRTYTPEDEQRRERVVVLSFGFWQRQFGASLNVVNQTVEIDGATAAIIGVMPADFSFPDKQAQLWFPPTILPSWDSRREQRDENDWLVIARLRGGVTVRQARSELAAGAGRLAASYPKANRGLQLRAVPLLAQMTGEQTPVTLMVLFAAVGCVLLIACLSVANLLLARSAARSREIALHTAHCTRCQPFAACAPVACGKYITGCPRRWFGLGLCSIEYRGCLVDGAAQYSAAG